MGIDALTSFAGFGLAVVAWLPVWVGGLGVEHAQQNQLARTTQKPKKRFIDRIYEAKIGKMGRMAPSTWAGEKGGLNLVEKAREVAQIYSPTSSRPEPVAVTPKRTMSVWPWLPDKLGPANGVMATV
jgi:hypothetical protein